ncbi:MAG: triphosphoribosyl-dephospho-CoA synthase [Hydrogenophaga sp.]|uniref:triphosphoribosyl-dephospho-CoA synthase n=1 Tax=Hydrogenophaga sp. TaxID=1904254 RepID=UPI0027259D5E|nr:triphosphoribosyl-dephospho-CoA synthase [Hydrogenophaga sp.]MDO9479715.1 triphosphoribosyl-dephospho-CoA synthase [Hydrogenophaga sp.]MDP3344079.1 triphosphoribosyl-dephospho-CoA synthase [Hydrogenophaga sp.]MDP3806003.1 triphosphoribosyl-dephospho-CoA synthase [Hydrogenophaga sp.]
MRSIQPAPTRHDRAWSATGIGRAATLALHDELCLAPKPGLVSLVDSGSHDDMDGNTFMRSLFALRHYFTRIAELGHARAPFSALEQCGLEAESRMLAATGGVNTHRGAIFMLGLLCAAVAAAQSEGAPLTPGAVRAALMRHWGKPLDIRRTRTSSLPGGVAARRFGLRSASEEAALGFPAVFEVAVPSWVQARRAGLLGARLKLQVFFEILAVLDDANLARRGGLAGLHHARSLARAFLANGGASRAGAVDDAQAIHRDFVARQLSPGGCADTLAATCFLERVGALP